MIEFLHHVWGEKVIVVTGKKGKVNVYYINDIIDSYEYHFRKSPSVIHTFEFKNGEFLLSHAHTF